MLGDFGAAAFYDRSDRAVAQALEQIEVRAFGCLLEELLERLNAGFANRAIYLENIVKIERLRDRCLMRVVAQRPLFQQIERELDLLLTNLTSG